MALFLLVLASAVGGTKWDAVTQLIGAGVHTRQRLSWPAGLPVSSQSSQSRVDVDMRVLAALTAGIHFCLLPSRPAETKRQIKKTDQ
jgi:hypothetical protein